MPFLLVHTADSFTPHPPPPFFMVFDRHTPRAGSKAALSELVFSPFFFFFFQPFWSRATRNLRMATFKFAMQGKRAPSCWNESLYLGGRSSVGGQMESRPSGFVAKDTAWQSARAEIFRSQRQTRAQTLSWWRNFIRVKKIYIYSRPAGIQIHCSECTDG